MGLFLKKSRGSITILVTLILIPSIFLTGFMVELSRIKLYGNLALMTADNYGETVLTNYDNLLKELYGLFAVTQNEEGKEALDDLAEYMKSSFAPNTNTISRQYLTSVLGKTEYEGFMPYQNADVTLSYEPIAESNLGNKEILSTQIGDFMKFRISQTMFDDGDIVLDAIEEIRNAEDNAEVIDKKCDLDEKAGEVLTEAQKYYEILAVIAAYPDYLDSMNSTYREAKSDILTAVNSDSYKIYKNYVKNEAAINSAVRHARNLQEGEVLTPQEQLYILMYQEYLADGNARRSYFEKIFNDAIKSFKDSTDSKPVDFDNYEKKTEELVKQGKKVKKEMDKLQELHSKLQTALAKPKVTQNMKERMEEELAEIEELFDVNGKFSGDNYVNLANDISSHAYQNDEQENHAKNIIERMEDMKEAYLDATSAPSFYSELDTNNWYYFTQVYNYNQLYLSLKEWFGETEKEAVKIAKQKKKASENLLKDAQNSLKNDETTTARNIPVSFGMGKNGSAGEFALTKMIKTAADYFSSNSFSQAGNKLLLQLYTVQYDFGMFSSRVTNYDNPNEEEERVETSLTGYEMSKKINYLYQAELEYLFSGFNSSENNLNEARNKILAFRAIVNFTATYTVKQVNDAIRAIGSAAAKANPVVGLVVSGALRLAIAGVETAQDWSVLKTGEGVVLIKNELNDLTCYDTICDLIGLYQTQTGQSKEFKLNYEQYLMVMLIFMTTPSEIAERTGNLITLNVNTVQQNIGENGTLSKLNFKLDNAFTAIKATCGVHLDFVMLPKGFASAVLNDDTYDEINEYEKNVYKFTVTRGY